MKKITEDLNLNFESQDWGIINASPDRLEEFVKYFETSRYSEKEKYELFELIIASYNDCLIEIKEKSKIFEDFISNTKGSDTYNTIINYWKNLDNDDEFPISKVIGGNG
ncbi:hypothetical protein [uncultured Psychroserpens sp.]|uniref:hypothetical protein n=1 Tax=uncultured Psychroserpens sp. TaxID=255436 RepID=UPI002638531F|nr:hypothetical protein [uncultured Psychroserpens sp.]